MRLRRSVLIEICLFVVVMLLAGMGHATACLAQAFGEIEYEHVQDKSGPSDG